MWVAETQLSVGKTIRSITWTGLNNLNFTLSHYITYCMKYVFDKKITQITFTKWCSGHTAK